MEKSQFGTIGLNVGTVGKWLRLIAGIGLILNTLYIDFLYPSSFSFYSQALLYFIVILLAYLAAHFFLGEKYFAKINPWITTLVLLGPAVYILMFQVGPIPFQYAFSFYVGISLIFNYVINYGGCEVASIPSLILHRKYVVYCPWNAVDIVEKKVIEYKK